MTELDQAGGAVANRRSHRVLRIIRATHPDADEAPPIVRKYVQYGASPRAAQAMILAGKALALLDGRYHVAADDVAQVALPALNHRIIRNFHGEMEQVSTSAIVAGHRGRRRRRPEPRCSRPRKPASSTG